MKTAKKAIKAPKAQKPKEVPAEVLGEGETELQNVDDVLKFPNLRRVNTAVALDEIEAKKLGRPTKLTPAVHQVIVTAKRNLPMSDADLAKLVGITPGLFSQWLTQGKLDEAAGVESRHRSFLNDYRAGEAGFEVSNLSVIAGARANGDWRAADRLNIIHFPAKYDPRVKVTHGGDPDAPPIQHQDVPLTEAQRKAMLDRGRRVQAAIKK